MKPSYREAISPLQHHALVKFLESQEEAKVTSSFYVNIVRQWLDSVPVSPNVPFAGLGSSPMATKEIQLLGGKVRLQLYLTTGSVGCHTVQVHNILVSCVRSLSPEEILKMREPFIEELVQAVLNAVGTRGHIIVSDNFDKPQRNEVATLGSRLRDVPDAICRFNRSSVGWSNGTPFFCTMDFIDLISILTEKDPNKYGQSVVTPFTTNPNYGSGSCRTLVWLPPIAFRDFNSTINTAPESLNLAWESWCKQETKDTNLTEVKKEVSKEIKKVPKTKIPPSSAA